MAADGSVRTAFSRIAGTCLFVNKTDPLSFSRFQHVYCYRVIIIFDVTVASAARLLLLLPCCLMKERKLTMSDSEISVIVSAIGRAAGKVNLRGDLC